MNTLFLKINDITADRDKIRAAAELLRRGEVVAMPTETVYGLAASAFDPAAVKKIFEAKGRPQDNPLIVHISETSQLYGLVRDVPEAALRLFEAYAPGPLTVILPKSDAVPDEVSAGLPTVAVRMPSHPVAHALIEEAGVPLAAPSANLSGFPSPTNATDVSDDMTGRVAAILDGGDCGFGIESTVVTLATDPPRVLRPGVVTVADLEKVLGKVEVDPAVLSPLGEGRKAASPGMKYRHYSPKASVTVCEGGLPDLLLALQTGDFDHALLFEGEDALCPVGSVTMGRRDEPLTQTKRLFDALRDLDRAGARNVLARRPAETGVGLGVCNRLYRAAGFRFLKAGKRGRIFGVCGPTGAGKSHVAALLRENGLAVIDADKVAREVLSPGSPLLLPLANAFGHDIIKEDGTLDRKALAARAFASEESARLLSSLTHPEIVRRMTSEALTLAAEGKDCVLDAPLLFTSKLYLLCDKTLKVTAPEDLRLRRITERDGLDEETAKKRIAAQREENAASEQADAILLNDGRALGEEIERFLRDL